MKNKNLNYLYILIILVIVFILFIGISMTIKESYYTYKYTPYDPSFKSNQILDDTRSTAYKYYEKKLYDTPIMYEPNKDYKGNTIKTLTGTNYPTCLYECIVNSTSCKGIVTYFTGNTPGTCDLKSKMTTKSNSSTAYYTRIS